MNRTREGAATADDRGVGPTCEDGWEALAVYSLGFFFFWYGFCGMGSGDDERMLGLGRILVRERYFWDGVGWDCD